VASKVHSCRRRQNALANAQTPRSRRPSSDRIVLGIDKMVNAFARPTLVVIERVTQFAAGEAASEIDESTQAPSSRRLQVLVGLFK